MIKKYCILSFCLVFVLSVWAEQVVHIANPKTWRSSSLSTYVNQTVSFDVPMYTVRSYSNYISPSCVSSYDSSNKVYMSGGPSVSRPRVYSTDLKARVVKSGDDYGLQYVSGSFDGNTRTALLQGPDMSQIDAKGEHTLLVCATNLEYYLVKNFGTGYGPASQKQHDAQRQKTRQALALINADIYGLCEVEQGTAAMQEICTDLNNAHPDRHYVYVDNKTSSAAGSYTMSGFVYDSLVVRAIGKCQEINTEVQHRKYMQCFKELSSQETFIFSMNHFKAMSGGGDTESRRIAEANAINANYESYRVYCDDSDLLIMGDLNCHAGDNPITILLQEGQRTDLHEFFHPEGSYSYVYAGVPNYLDHAIANATMLPQITGIQAFHVNSDEDDCTYDKACNDGTMFRYSDHDPILVGLRLSSVGSDEFKVLNYGSSLQIQNGAGGYIRIFDRNGFPVQTIQGDDLFPIQGDNMSFPLDEQRMMPPGLYIVHVYFNGKLNVTKYIRP